MKLSIDDICRGSGKFFFNLRIQEKPEGSSIRFSFTVPDGRDVPAMVFEPDSPGLLSGSSEADFFQAALPLLRKDIKMTVTAQDEAGLPLGSCEHIFKSKQVKWEGKLNSITRRDAVRKLRGSDEGRTLNRCIYYFIDYLAPQPFDGLLRGIAYLPVSMSPEPPVLVCHDADFNEYPDAVTYFPARRSDDLPILEKPFWEMQFSIEIPHTLSLAVISAKTPDGRDLPGYAALEHAALDKLHKGSVFVFDNAQWDPGYDEYFRRKSCCLGSSELQRHITLEDNPSFSIIVPLYNTPLDLFGEMVDSVRKQTYGNWELILVNASPDLPELAEAVAQAVEGDERIKSIELEGNGGITLNTNAGVAVAEGDFISFFDHDDVLAPNILFEYAKAVNEHPDTDILYCDEDKLTPDGTYIQPFFKPDFSIDLLRNNNYICHMLTIRASLLRELPVQGPDFDGAQDHNLTLMASEKARHIHHVPEVLYHWRMTEGSTAASTDNKDYAGAAGVRAVQSHLDRLGIDATVEPAPLAFNYKVTYHVQGNPLVSIIIPNKDHTDLLDTCLQSIFSKTAYENLEVLVIENNSTEEATFEYYRQAQERWGNLRVEEWPGTGFNFAAIMNYGMQQAEGDYYLFLNNDTEVITEQWVGLMLGMCQREDVGAVGACLLFPDGTIQHNGLGITGDAVEHLGLFLPAADGGYFGIFRAIRDVSAVTGACMMTKRSIMDEVGGFDERFTVAYNDIDLCLKIRELGKLVVMNPYVELYHYESMSRNYDKNAKAVSAKKRFIEERSLILGKWADEFAAGDPYLNPNLEMSPPMARYYTLKRD